MLVIVTENIPDRLHGYLSRWLLEVRPGVFIDNYSIKVREHFREVLMKNIDAGDAVLAWTALNETGFDFDTIGTNRRVPQDFDGIKLVSFLPSPMKKP